MSNARTWLRTNALLAAVCVLPTAAAGQERCPAAGPLTAGLKQAQAAVRYLADDSLHGRLAGSPDERCAGAYLAAEFKRLGLRPGGEGGTYFQSLWLPKVLEFRGGTGRNVIGVLRGRHAAGPVVVIGAHYDHLGLGGQTFGSAAPDDVGVAHPGADDNASGTAALLEVARLLAQGPQPQASVLFVAFTCEEEGSIGSTYYTKHPTVPLSRVRAMLNLDMVGRLGTGSLVVYGTGTAQEWPAVLTAANAGEDALVLREIASVGESDQTSFYDRDVPVLHFFTHMHSDYHKPSDTWDRLDYAGIERVAALVSRVASEVAARPAALTLIRRADRPSR